jgi:hypothetical protein
MFQTAKSKPSIELGRWNIVALTVAGFWVVYFSIFLFAITSSLIEYFRFGSLARAGAERFPTAKLTALYLQHILTWLPLGVWSLVTGVCLALGVRRYPVGRGAGLLAFFAGTFMYMCVVSFTKIFDELTPLIQWLQLGVFSMGAPWLLGRAISHIWP